MDTRSWGRNEILKMHECCKVQELIVNPGKNVLCKHLNPKHLIVTRGIARVTIEIDTQMIQTNQHINIPAGVKHNIENPSNEILILIEVQVGNYFGDTDVYS